MNGSRSTHLVPAVKLNMHPRIINPIQNLRAPERCERAVERRRQDPVRARGPGEGYNRELEVLEVPRCAAHEWCELRCGRGGGGGAGAEGLPCGEGGGVRGREVLQRAPAQGLDAVFLPQPENAVDGVKICFCGIRREESALRRS